MLTIHFLLFKTQLMMLLVLDYDLIKVEELMAKMHGRLPDGTWIEGVEVFRRLYSAVGLGPLVALSRIPGISHLADLGYRVFAKNRLRLTGRCQDGACEIPPARSVA